MIAAALVVASAGLSFALSLDVHARMLLAASRMVVQLLLVGLFLRTIFMSQLPAVTVLVVVLMLLAASGRSARGAPPFPERMAVCLWGRCRSSPRRFPSSSSS